MKDKWTIEEVTSSDNCRYNKAAYDEYDNEYKACLKLIASEHDTGFGHRTIYQKCTKENCPLRVVSS